MGGGECAEDGNPGSNREEKGGDGWLVGVRMCVSACVCLSDR